MKDRNNKHKFKESKIGKIIYGFLLFMPLFAIGITCGYAMFNKNAYNSWSLTQSSEYTLIDNQTELKEKEIYKFTTNRDLYNSRSLQIINIEVGSLTIITGTNSTNFLTAKSFEIYYNGNNQQYSFHVVYATNSNYYINIGNYDNPVNYQFTFIPTQNYNNNDYLTNIQKIQFGEQNYLDNVFYQSVDKVTQSDLFNWVTTSNIYTGMHNFTTAMSVTNTFIPMLLTYWLIISVIYFLYDMVLILLTVLHRKIHNLQDSI